MSVRACPLPHHPRPAGWPGPYCRWCGGPIYFGRKDRSWHDGRAEEPNCAYEKALHTDRLTQVRFVGSRDGEQCCDCGAKPMRWRRGSVVYILVGHVDRVNPLCEWVTGTRYQDVEWVTALELEHEVPLWSIAHLPDDERRPYFGPLNLKLRGPCCHKPKTKAEAKDRAKGNRQAKMRLDVPVERAKRPIRSAGFRKTGPKQTIPSRPFQRRKT